MMKELFAMQKKRSPLVIGHRGAAGEAPENTLSSFRLAFEQGADAIELDVHLSADGELVVIHDHTIDRTTTGQGAVAELTLEQLKRVDAGLKFDERFRGERIPTLAEVFEIVPDRAMVNIEIKAATGGALEDRLIALLRGIRRMEQAVISSYDHKCLHYMKRQAPETKVGLLYTSNLVDHRLLASTFEAEVYSLHPYYQLIAPEDIRLAVGSGLQVYPYTVNDEASLRALLRTSVSGIITDYPGRLRRMIGAS